MANDYALFRRFPGLAQRLPRAELAALPTPLESAPSLATQLGVSAVLVKRDDVSSPIYGGGKVRKLELLLAAAQARGFGRVLTSGGVGSHHALATALFSHELGLGARLLLLPQPPSDEVRTTLLASRRAGAELQLVGSAAQIERIAARSSDHYVIAPGGSSSLGNLAFVNAGLEIAEQLERQHLPEPEAVFIAMGTMGSAVGLAIGLGLAELNTKVIAVRASNQPTSSRAKLDALLDETLAQLRSLEPSLAAWKMDRSRLVIDPHQLGRGYAQPTLAGRRAAELYTRHLGGSLDSTYTAKAFAALLASARAEPGRRVLVFYNTHNGADVPTDGVSVADLPVELRPYAR